MNMRRWIIFGLAVLMMAMALAALGMAGTAPGDLSQPGLAGRQKIAQADNVWNSGWVNIHPGQGMTFTHNVGGDPARYAVDLWYRDTRSEGLGVHHRAYGGMDVAGQRHGVHWQNLTGTTIRVVRWRDDVAASQVNLRIWIPDPILYDSRWMDVSPGQPLTLNHGLGGDVDDYTLGVKFRDTTPGGQGIHHYAAGGLEAGGVFHGAAWQNFTNTTIQVLRFGGDTSVHQVRVLIRRPNPPDYDSGWVTVPRGERRTLTHSLGGNPNSYIVRAFARATAQDGPGINTRAAGGMEVGGEFLGANWQNLTSTGINVFRQPHDIFAGQIRVRIWRPERRVYLPLIARNFPPAAETAIAYDDGTAESSQSYTAGNGFAVRFTTPGGSGRLVRARYYLLAPVAPIEVHVWDADHNDLITPFTATPAGDGWFDVDLSSLNLTVSGDFYVGFLYTVDTDPTLGVDTSSPDGRSYEVPWEEVGYDFMIRALVVE